MNAAEMHAFEEAMMDDPFLADAVDGYRTVVPRQTIQNDLTELQQRINNKKENGKLITGFFKPGMQLAAVAIILLATAVTLYRLLNKPEVTDTAVVKPKQTEQTAPVTTKPTEVDSSTIAMADDVPAPVVGTPVSPKQKRQSTVPPVSPAETFAITETKPVVNDSSSNDVAMNTTAAAPPPVAAANEMQQNSNKAAKMEMKAKSVPVKLNRFAGVVVDENNQPLPFANIVEVKSGVGTYADAKGNFVMVAGDSVLSIETRSVGYSTANVQIRTSNQQKIVLRDEAVTYGNLSKEQLFERNKQRNSRMKEELTEMESEPIDGWDKYSTYVLNNTRNSRFTDEKIRLQDKSSVKEVEVSFDVLPDGNITNFKVERSNCATCNNEAIRVLKEGPKWKSKSGKTERTRFTVQF